MSGYARGVLALTDLTQRSDAALLVAGRIAEERGVPLDVVHAMGLKSQTLQRVAPILNDLTRHIETIDRAARVQLAQLHPHWATVPGVVIDMDSPAEALVRRARQAQPLLIAAPSGWSWHPLGRRSDSLHATALRALPAPLLLLDEYRRTNSARVLLFVDPEAFDHEWINAACHWHARMQRAARGRIDQSVPDVDVIFVEPGSDRAAWLRHINTTPADLVAVALPMLDGLAQAEADQLLARLVAGVNIPVILLHSPTCSLPAPEQPAGTPELVTA